MKKKCLYLFILLVYISFISNVTAQTWKVEIDDYWYAKVYNSSNKDNPDEYWFEVKATSGVGEVQVYYKEHNQWYYGDIRSLRESNVLTAEEYQSAEQASSKYSGYAVTRETLIIGLFFRFKLLYIITLIYYLAKEI